LSDQGGAAFGPGARFTLRFPAAAASDEAGSAAAAAAAP
jgi:hypothetical protein